MLTPKRGDCCVFCSLEQLALSPQSGFYGEPHMSEDEVSRKLQLAINTAQKVWG